MTCEHDMWAKEGSEGPDELVVFRVQKHHSIHATEPAVKQVASHL